VADDGNPVGHKGATSGSQLTLPLIDIDSTSDTRQPSDIRAKAGTFCDSCYHRRSQTAVTMRLYHICHNRILVQRLTCRGRPNIECPTGQRRLEHSVPLDLDDMEQLETEMLCRVNYGYYSTR